MRFLIWGINYAPEALGIAPCNVALCEGLVKAGHEVVMLTTFPYYPEWRKRPEDRGCRAQSSVQRGVRVERVWHYVPARPTALRRIVHELSFVVASAWRATSLGRPDTVVVVAPPLALGVAGRILCKLWGCPYVFHVQDLQPEAALALGMLKPGCFAKVLHRLADMAYAGAALVSAISQEMLEHIGRRGVPQERMVVFPNGIPSEAPGAAPDDRAQSRKKWGVSEGEMLLVYSGNMGEKQGLDVLLEGMRRLPSGSGTRLVLSGGGARFECLRMAAQQCCGRVRVVATLAEREFWELLQVADGLVVAQRAGTSEFFLPSKLLAYLAAGKPILGVADLHGSLARWIQRRGVGLVAAPEPEAVVRLFQQFRLLQEERSGMGKAAAREREALRWPAILDKFIARLAALR